MENTQPRFVKWAIVLAIVIVLNLFFVVMRALIIPTPVYEDFCPAAKTPAPAAMTAATCDAQGGIWNPYPQKDQTGALGYCDMFAKCQQPYQDAQTQYQMYAFVFSVALGVLALIVGVLPLGSSIISLGLTYGGVISFIIASVGYWNEAGNWLRLGITGLALLVLLYIAWRKFKD